MNDPESLVLVPGLVCDEEVWAAQIAGLAGRWPVHVAGHEPDDSLGRMAERILDIAPARFALAGHSMGGRVALEIMARAAGRVTRLALLDTGFEMLATGEAGERERAGRYRLRDIARAEGMLAMGREWALGMVHPARLGDEPLMNAIHQMIARASVALFESQIEALLARPDRRHLLPAIRVPTLVLCGNEDSWSPLARHVEMAGMIAGSELVGVADCGHMSTMERPAAITAALGEWMQRSR
jgi:pimeloyl-ACP methyl ester carboxylesterase